MPPDENKVYITFDDGPHPEITPKVISLLRNYNAEAAFFCVGDNVRKYPDVFKYIKSEGHSVGNHSFNHLNGWKTKNNIYYKNIEKADNIISSGLFRPPFGRISPAQIRHLKKQYEIVMWSVLSYDFDARISREDCLGHSVNNCRPGSIIVFHDSEKAKGRMFYALEGFLDYFSQKRVGFAKLLTNK